MSIQYASFVADSASSLWRADILSFGWNSEEEEEEEYHNDITRIIKAHLIVYVCVFVETESFHCFARLHHAIPVVSLRK